jgi:hypothetical protein
MSHGVVLRRKQLYFDFALDALDFGFFFLRHTLSFFTNAQSLGL